MSQHCVVTGGADGIGRAVAERYAARGAAVTIVDRDAARAEALCAALRANGSDANFSAADLSSAAAVERTVATLGQLPAIDLLVHSAGISAVGPFAATPLPPQLTVLDVNLRAPLLLTNGLLRAGRIAPGATLVFVASLSVFTSYPGAAAYAASKDGIAAYARSLRVALAAQRINVLTVYPGPTRTAHARRYSPDNRREGRRMPPEQLAALLARAVERRQTRLIPGTGNRLAALAGRLFPSLLEYVMRRTLLEQLERTPPPAASDQP